MLITPDQPRSVDRALRAGQLACPGDCQGHLRPWGWARQRPIRSADRVRLIRPRRGHCNDCATTHVLIPASILPGRAYAMSMIGSALRMAADGRAHRRIAADLGVPPDTVRGWLRRLRDRAPMLLAHSTALALRLDGRLARLDPPGGWTSSVQAAVGAAGVAAAAFSRMTDGLADRWEALCAVTAGLLLANTSRPFPTLD